MKKACCGFGHRNVFTDISMELDKAIQTVIKQGCEIFYTGAMGNFDSLFSSAVRKAKKTYPYIKLICVKPYFTNDINVNRDYYTNSYDDIIIPDELAHINYKAAIKARNRWMIDNSEFVIVYTKRNYGGAYETQRYALNQHKQMIILSFAYYYKLLHKTLCCFPIFYYGKLSIVQLVGTTKFLQKENSESRSFRKNF